MHALQCGRGQGGGTQEAGNGHHSLMRMVRAGLTEEVFCVLGLEGRSGRSGLPPLPPVCVPAGV